MSIKVDSELCTACESCVASCPYGGIKIVDTGETLSAVITSECNLCGACVDACPVEAITLCVSITREGERISGYFKNNFNLGAFRR
jgi:NAD-dependent dihydropyrimidine dehydrogenase PreA subunit